MQKNTVLTIGLLSLAGLGLTTADAGVKVIMNQSTPLGMVGDTEYDLDNNIIEIVLDRPVICNKKDNQAYPNGITKLKIYDPNREMQGGFGTQDGLYFDTDANYEIQNGHLLLDTYNPAKALCVSAESGNYDLIYKDPFETPVEAAPLMQYVGLPDIVSPGQELNYEIHLTNPSTAPSDIYFDLMEYWHKNSGHAAYMFDAGSRTCNPSNSVVCDASPISKLKKNVRLSPGNTLELKITQVVDSNSIENNNLEFMAAAFLRNGSNGDFKPRVYSNDFYEKDVHVISKTVSVQDNTPPVVTWTNGQPSSVSFYEDENNELTFDFEFFDMETHDLSDITPTVSVKYNTVSAMIDFLGIAQNGNHQYSVKIKPEPDAFTNTGDPEVVTITVDDNVGGQSTLTFNVDISSVNDAPTFALNCNELTINEQNTDLSCTSAIGNGGGNQIQGVWGDEYIIASFDPGPNESHQLVQKYEVEIVDNSDGVLDTFGSGSAVTIDKDSGEVTIHTNNGVYGTALVRVRVKDNDGVAGANGCDTNDPGYEASHGCDVSDWKPLTIVSQPFKYSVSGEVLGLPTSKSIQLKLTGTENGISVDVNTNITVSSTQHSFTLQNGNGQPQLLDDGTTYTVIPDLVPNGYTCNVTNGTGTINGSDITNVEVSCSN
ncbi:hypothetical protein [Marinicella gelatinilytica]|uniref:hypothetical protein n=1 Tax=Marinicella gelatinilytica TaxID=2996017 RepID=UPI00226089A0|nr:hypothetical protein [Marinicella gelatinilytica]MCX7545084.1 hypothetical protein [Marinicella gelatinilytica]